MVALSPAQAAKVDSIVATTMRDQHIAGLSLGIARGGVPLYFRGYGMRDVERALPAQPDTVYYAGSIAKQFTAALVMQQVALSRIDLNARLRRYFPEAGAGGGVSILQLLGQVSGLPSYTDRSTAGMVRLSESNPTPLALWQLAAQLAPLFPPGEAWRYSNTNYLGLGIVLQNVTGSDYGSLLRDRIAGPLGLHATAYGVSSLDDVATGYAWRDGFSPMPMSAGVLDVAFSAGGITSSAPDLLAWLEALRTGRVVSPASFIAMATPVRLSDGTPSGYGFGFFTGNWYGYRVLSHGGNINGYSSEDALVLDDALEIAVLANADRVDLTPLSKSIVAIVDPPRDPNLYAGLSQPAENENPRITADVKAIASTPAFAALGPLASVEFTERSTRDGVTYDKYRLTFATGRWWLTIGYRADEAIASLALEPDAG